MGETTAAGSTEATPLEALHRALGARMIEFAGFQLPLHYRAGIRREHVHTRARASLFDVSHMGQVLIRGGAAAAALERLVPSDLEALAAGRMRYALFTLDSGGVLDDLMITRVAAGLLLVVNASRRRADLDHLRAALPAGVAIDVMEERALLAVQGPAAVNVLEALAPGVGRLRFMAASPMAVAGVACQVSRSGYTGEDGFEIACAAADAEGLATRILEAPQVEPGGLGARDTLRLEAGLCLYGNELDHTTTPVEADLTWAVSRCRRPGGARAGGYPGAGRIEHQLLHGAERRRVGLRPEGRVPARDGAELADARGRSVGRVTSGGFGPSLDAPVAMGYVSAEHAEVGRRLFARVRGRELPVQVVSLPFVAHRYVR